MREKSFPGINTLKEYFQEIIPHFKNKPLVRGIKSGPILYVGDLHGFYSDLLNAFKIAEKKGVQTIVFLGDYSDRGKNQLKTLLKVMDAYARSEGFTKNGLLGRFIREEKYPFKIIALRGNHEDTEINNAYGFHEELRYTHEYPEFPNKILDELYSNLPIIATTKWKTIAVHGGIPKSRNLEQVSRIIGDLIPRKTPLKIDLETLTSSDLMTQIYQLLWNDPYFGNEREKAKFRPSFRGPNIYEFNRKALEDFLKINDYLRLVRAHETAPNGYEVHWNNKLIHIFSAAPYFGRVKSAAYFLEFNDSSGEIVNGSGNTLRKVEPAI